MITCEIKLIWFDNLFEFKDLIITQNKKVNEEKEDSMNYHSLT